MINNQGGRSAGFHRDKWKSYASTCAGDPVRISDIHHDAQREVKNVQQDDLRDQMENHPMGAILLEAFELCLKKNDDYATKDDIFANFMLASTLDITPSVGVAVRLSDKWQRFTKGVRTNWDMSIKDEKVKDTMIDIINYSAIYYCLYMKENR